jgi:carbamoyltransferase
MITAFNALTGCPLIINTSFNVRGEPIVESPEDAYKCFMRTNMDFLVMGNFILDKKAQPVTSDNRKWLKEFELD